MLKLYGYRNSAKSAFPDSGAHPRVSGHIEKLRFTGTRGERERGNGCAGERAIIDERTDEETKEGGSDERASEQTEERFKERPRSFSLCPVRSRYRVGEILLSQPRDGESPMREHKGPPACPPSEEKEREERKDDRR